METAVALPALFVAYADAAPVVRGERRLAQDAVLAHTLSARALFLAVL